MFFCDYPILRTEKELPLFLVNMGQQHCQDHIIRPEGYPCPQILFCTKGSGTLLMDGDVIPIPPFTAIYMPAHHPHEYYPDGDVWDIHWVVPSGYAAEDILKHFGLSEPKIFELKEVKMLEHIFRKMHEAIRADSVFGNYRASGYLYDFLIEFYRLTSSSGVSGATNSALMKAVDHINFNFASQITMDDLCAVSSVSKQYLWQDKYKANIGSKWIEHDRLFTKWNGEPMGMRSPYKFFEKFCKRTGMRFVNVHSFRHFNATAMILSGVDVKTVQTCLGHNDANTTLSIYAHSFQEAQARAMDSVADCIFNKNNKKDNSEDKKSARNPIFENNGQTTDKTYK